MATDYDAPRTVEEEPAGDTIALAQRARETPGFEGDESEASSGGWDSASDSFGDVDLDVIVLPPQADEFTCTECFLVVSNVRAAGTGKYGPICDDCAA
jgi:hypothetical protein